MIQAIVAGIIRAILAAVGGSLVTKGVLDADQLAAGIGAVLTLVTIAWSARQKWTAKQKALNQVEKELGL